MAKSTGRLFPRSFEGQAPREFGQGANIIKTRTFDLAVARNLEAIDIGGSCLWAIAASSLTAIIDVYINDQLRDPITFSQGMFIRGIPFSRLFVSHAAQPGETITLMFAVEEDVRNIQIINPTLAFNQINVTKATALETITDVAMIGLDTTEILPANPVRRVAYITNLLGNAETLRVGDAAAADTRGTPLAPGDTITIETTEAVHAYKPVAGNENVAVTWTED